MGGVVEVAPGGAALGTRAVRRSGSTRTPRIAERSQTSPPSFVPKPGTLWPPPRTDEIEPLLAGEFDRGHHVGDVGARG